MICKISYSCFISVQIALQLLYCDITCQHIIQYWRTNREIHWMNKRKGKLREIPGWITIEDSWEGKGNRREKRNRNSSSYKECLSIGVGKGGHGFLRQMVSIDLSISPFGSSSMVMGLTKSHLKTPYKQKRITLRSWFNFPVQTLFLTYGTKSTTIHSSLQLLLQLQTVVDVDSQQIPMWDRSASQVNSPDLRAFLSPSAPLLLCRSW